MTSILTENGLQIDRYPTILSDIVKRQQELISPDITARDDEFLGQLNSILAERESNLLSLIEAVNSNYNVDEAEGTALDNIGKLLKVARKQPLQTQGYINLTGISGTTVPSGTIVEHRLTKDRYYVVSNTNIDDQKSVANTISISSIANTTDYTVTLGSTDYTYTSDGTATQAEILAGVVAEIQADVDRVADAVVSGSTIKLTSVAPAVSYSVAVSANLSIESTSTRGYVTSSVTGPLEAAAGTITKIITPVLGLNSVNNTIALTEGRNREIDEDYRFRLKTESTSQGLATLPSIFAYLENTANITYAKVYHNPAMVEDGEGRPPKSVECVIEGATDEAVAEAIHYAVAGGIETYGNTGPIAFTNSEGVSVEVSFSRPTPKYFSIQVYYSLYPEEDFPDGGETTIQLAVKEFVNALGIGVDLIPKRIYKPIYDAVPGLSELWVTATPLDGPGGTPTGSSTDARIAVAGAEYAQVDIGDISVALD